MEFLVEQKNQNEVSFGLDNQEADLDVEPDRGRALPTRGRGALVEDRCDDHQRDPVKLR